MNDHDLIALLRRKLRERDDAIHSYLDVMERTGLERKVAWDALKAQPLPRMGLPSAVTAAFLDAYERTMPERAAAMEALHAALTMTFRDAVLTGDDWTPEQRAYWLEQSETADGRTTSTTQDRDRGRTNGN